MSTSSSAGVRATDRPGRGRRLLVRGLLVVGVPLPAVYLTSVVTDALGLSATHRVGSVDDPAPSAEALAGAAAPSEAVHVTGAVAVLLTVLVAAAALFIRPDRPSSARYLLATFSALVPVALIVGDPDNYGGQAGLVDPLFLALPVPAALAALVAGPWTRRAAERGPRLALLGFVVLGVGPAVWWGVRQALMQRNTYPPTADPHHNSHWYVIAVLTFMVLALSVLAVLNAEGWRLAAATAAADALAVAVVSLFAPQSASALGPFWSGAVIAWAFGVGFAVVRRAPTPRLLLPDRSERIHP
ncbi:MAG TPA: hypothetical protein VD834_13135 [Blastococcus sp.]|nr:hypothetical protein [Blastococcus sp.]